MSEIEWANVSDAAVKEKFGGTIRVRTVWQAPSGATAQVVEIDPGACWEGLDVHEPGPEEVYVVSGVFNDEYVTIPPVRLFITRPAHPTYLNRKPGAHCLYFIPRDNRIIAAFAGVGIDDHGLY